MQDSGFIVNMVTKLKSAKITDFVGQPLNIIQEVLKVIKVKPYFILDMPNLPKPDELCYDLEINSPISVGFEMEELPILQLESLFTYISRLDHSLFMQDMIMQNLEQLAKGERISSFRFLLQDLDFDATDDGSPKQKLAYHL